MTRIIQPDPKAVVTTSGDCDGWTERGQQAEEERGTDPSYSLASGTGGGMLDGQRDVRDVRDAHLMRPHRAGGPSRDARLLHSLTLTAPYSRTSGSWRAHAYQMSPSCDEVAAIVTPRETSPPPVSRRKTDSVRKRRPRDRSAAMVPEPMPTQHDQNNNSQLLSRRKAHATICTFERVHISPLPGTACYALVAQRSRSQR
ncbi:hypothetical protein A1Q2_07775 [Trichosporon asahii var. asahii CBS 8904]|uniref:Uncharacterized protein n=1 Tax=Trichosporon asahii var. asahii (strain CBS 8904) TaxID=1220162 RepID=K1W8K3_TRIAC|nr:hypothetical protein A1Q2_07775 [Trichosporon asahii var. asahii CBS 8904]